MENLQSTNLAAHQQQKAKTAEHNFQKYVLIFRSFLALIIFSQQQHNKWKVLSTLNTLYKIAQTSAH